MTAIPQTLDPALLASIGDLELVARVTVEGTLSGLHRSPFHGYSAEFSQYRHYRPGDDLKYIDWKLFARTDRVYTKQYRETTNLGALVAVDTSASMGYRGGGRVSKLDYARMLAAALAYLLIGQGDAVGLAAYGERMMPFVGVRSGQPHLRAFVVQVGQDDEQAAAAEQVERAPQRGGGVRLAARIDRREPHEQAAQVRLAGARRDVLPHAIAVGDEAGRVALPDDQVSERRGEHSRTPPQSAATGRVGPAGRGRGADEALSRPRPHRRTNRLR